MASTPLSAGSVRQQFSIPENILLSRFGYEFLTNCHNILKVEDDDEPDIQFRKGGYMYLVSKQGEDTLRENYEIQRSVGAKVKLMTPPELSIEFPWINTEDVSLASIGISSEGAFDPYSLLQCVKKKVLSMSVRFIDGEVVNVNCDQSTVTDVEVKSTKSASSANISCQHLVNACGPWAANLALMAGIGRDKDGPMSVPLPVKPAKRYVYVFQCPTGPKSTPALVIDLSGLYFRRESSGNYICGRSPSQDQEPDIDNLDCDYQYFSDELWPLLAKRVPAFEAIKVVSGWAGFYEYNTFDQNGIIGCHPEIENFYFINGFSGHGIQQSPAAGRAVSELILDKSFTTIDLKRFGFERFIKKEPLLEKNVI